MKFIRNTFDKFKPSFEKGGKYEKYGPVFNAFDTIFFLPNHVCRNGVHVRDGVDLKRIMSTVIFAMVPALLFGMYNAGYHHYSQLVAAGQMEGFTFMDAFTLGAIKMLPLVVVSYGVGLGIEFAFAVWRGHEVQEGYLVTGMLIPLIVPVDLPLWMLAIAVVFAVVIGKEVFGGTGMNILNPALTARAFLFFAYPSYMSGDKIWVHEASTVDAISGETILGTLAQNNSASYSVMEMALGFIPGSIGETSVVAILIGAAYLIFTGVGSWKIMLSAVLGGAVMGGIFNLFAPVDNMLMNFAWWKHLLVGGFAFGVVFMATDPVSAAQTERGKWFYGFFVGIFAIMIRVFNPAYPEGIMLSILLMNVFAPLIDYYVIQGNIKRRKSRVKTVSVAS